MSIPFRFKGRGTKKILDSPKRCPYITLVIYGHKAIGKTEKRINVDMNR